MYTVMLELRYVLDKSFKLFEWRFAFCVRLSFYSDLNMALEGHWLLLDLAGVYVICEGTPIRILVVFLYIALLIRRFSGEILKSFLRYPNHLQSEF